ncbi:MAG: sigma-70 family RNA polymerase sigma factor [Candidatus Poribacteria bacterium]|nr:sigma-70 family RNA polymerase sigma factor [Candidatus Poribacteria bacterium]
MKNDDAKYVERILAGDTDAFTTLVKKYEKQIHAFVWRRVKDYHVAEEITQDTFLRAYEKLGTLRDPNRFSGWLYMIATRRFLTWFDEKTIPMQSLDAMSKAEVEALFYVQYMAEQIEKLATDKQREVVAYLLEKLPARERTAVVLHYLSEMTCEEIGDFLGVSPNTVKSQLHRARKRLKKEAPIVHEILGGSRHPEDLMEDIMNWIQMNEPGTRQVVNTLSVTSDKTLYAVIGDESIYKLPAGEETWRLVNSEFLRQDTHGSIPIAEYDGTLYIIPAHELFASTDEGATWHSVGPCPKGYTRELIITEGTFYLCLDNGIFRSDDAGNSWTAITDGLHDRLTEHAGIRSLRIHQSTLFAGTNRGIYRLNAGTWEHLQLPVDDIVSVDPVVVSEDHIYIAVSVNILEGDGTPQENFMPLWRGEKLSWWVFRSADGGDSWTDITPVEARDLMRVLPQITLLTSEKTLLVIGKDNGMVVRSTDCGDTWTYIESSGITPMQFSVGSALALDPNTFYTRGCTGIHRATDGGQTWHRFNTRFESRVDGLVSFMAGSASNKSPALYARVGPNLVKSIDEGRSWDAVNVALETDGPSYKENPPLIVQVVEADGVLYAKGIRRSSTAIFRLSNDGSVLSLPTEVPPSFSSAQLMGHVLGGRNFNFKDERQMGQGLIVTISSTIDPLSDELIRENPDFGAERFLKQLIQVQADAAFTYELIWEGMWGNFAVSGKTFYMEYNYKLYRWKPGETEWFYTGVEETVDLSRANARRSFKIAASGETVYVAKRDGHLWQSVDGGDSWNDITSNLPLSIERFDQIVFTDATVHIATDKGVFNSKDGVVWNLLIDQTGEPVIIKSLATASGSVYGANDDGIYRLQSETDTWEQVAPEISGIGTSLVVDENTFYVGTEQRGVLCFKRSV